MKPKIFKKVIKPKVALLSGRVITEKDVIIYFTICAIPIIGQIFWLMSLIWYFSYGRETYFEEVR